MASDGGMALRLPEHEATIELSDNNLGKLRKGCDGLGIQDNIIQGVGEFGDLGGAVCEIDSGIEIVLHGVDFECFSIRFFQHIYNPRMPEIGKIGGLSLFNGEKVFYIAFHILLAIVNYQLHIGSRPFFA